MTQLINRLHLFILNVGLAIHNADWNWENVSSPFARLYYVTGGTAKIVFSFGTYELKPGYLYLIPSFVPHSYSCTSYFSHYYLHIYEDTQFESSLLEDWDFPVEIPAGELDLELIRRLCVLNPAMGLPQSDPTTYDNDSTLVQNIIKNKQSAFAIQMETKGIIYQLISRFLICAKPKVRIRDGRIEKALAYMQQNIYKPIGIEQLSQISCLSKDHFIRLFKKEMRTTPLQYITQKKIEKAQLMLITQNIPIKGIAYRLGYDDHSYFIRTFRRTVGETPQEYREKHGVS